MAALASGMEPAEVYLDLLVPVLSGVGAGWADGTVTVCATAASHACLPMAPQNQRYCNPFRDVTSLVPERIDQGVDYGGAGPIYAMGPGTIDVFKNRNDTGWPGGTFVSYKLSAALICAAFIPLTMDGMQFLSRFQSLTVWLYALGIVLALVGKI